MRPLVIISLLSLIGVIKCRPQQTLGQDIPVSTQIRYQNPNPTQFLSSFNYRHQSLPITPITQKAVRKNSSSNSGEKIVPNSTQKSRNVPVGYRNVEISLSTSKLSPRQNKATHFLENNPGANTSRSISNPKLPLSHETPIIINRTVPKSTPIPDLRWQNFSSPAVQTQFSIFGNETPESGPHKWKTEKSSERSTLDFVPRTSYSVSSSNNVPGNSEEETIQTILATLGNRADRKSGQSHAPEVPEDSSSKESSTLARKIHSLSSTEIFDLHSQSSNWFQNLTSFFKNRMAQFAQNRTLNLSDGRFLSGISTQNGSGNSGESQRSEDSKKRLRWHIFKSLFQRKLDLSDKVKISNAANPINITAALNTSKVVLETGQKFNRNYNRKSPSKISNAANPINITVALNTTKIVRLETDQKSSRNFTRKSPSKNINSTNPINVTSQNTTLSVPGGPETDQKSNRKSPSNSHATNLTKITSPENTTRLVPGGLATSLEQKTNRNFKRKSPNKILRPPNPPNPDDVFNLKFNITKLSPNEYKITSKNNLRNVTKTKNGFPKNSTRNNIYRPKPLVRPYFQEESKKPFQDNQNNKWFQLKLKNPNTNPNKHEGTEKHYDFSTLPSIYFVNSHTESPGSVHGVSISNHAPLERPSYNPYYQISNTGTVSNQNYGSNGLVFNNYYPSGGDGYNSNSNNAESGNLEDFQGDLPIISNTISTQHINGANNLVIHSSLTTPGPGGFSSNGPHIGNTITLSPEVVSISQGSHTLAGPDNPCTNLHIQSNVYNKEACQDLEITINNHVITENNYYDEEETGFQEDVEDPDYDEDDYVDDSNEATESAIISDQEYEDELVQEAVVQEPVVSEPLPAEASVVENPVQAASSAGTNPASSSGGLPNRPNLPALSNLGSGSSEEEDDAGLFGANGLFSWFTGFDLFNYPIFGLLAAPLTIMLTSAIGISTIFLPWTVLPTLFLGRKARQRSSVETFGRPFVSRPDGWFWHNKYKTWVNLTPEEGGRSGGDWGTVILDLIEDFGRRYAKNYNESWKRRKKENT